MKAITLLIFSCYSVSTINIYQQIYIYELMGKWEVIKITENDEDISSSINNNAQRWIEFIGDDSY